jgi:hypothetical protein
LRIFNLERLLRGFSNDKLSQDSSRYQLRLAMTSAV